MMKSTACCSSRSRKPQRRYRFSPAQSGTRECCLTSRIAAAFSGGTGSSSQSNLKGSSAPATAMPLAMS